MHEALLSLSPLARERVETAVRQLREGRERGATNAMHYPAAMDTRRLPRRLATALLALLPAAASADQFAYLDLEQAVTALDALEHAPRTLQAYCAPCGDAHATAIEVHDMGLARVWNDRTGAQAYVDADGRTFWEIEVNGAGIDLAYVYVQTPAGWENLALMLGLEASGVPRMLPPERLPH